MKIKTKNLWCISGGNKKYDNVIGKYPQFWKVTSIMSSLLDFKFFKKRIKKEFKIPRKKNPSATPEKNKKFTSPKIWLFLTKVEKIRAGAVILTTKFVRNSVALEFINLL